MLTELNWLSIGALMNRILTLGILENFGKFLISLGTVRFSSG
jgi:hypothetical protein